MRPIERIGASFKKLGIPVSCLLAENVAFMRRIIVRLVKNIARCKIVAICNRDNCLYVAVGVFFVRCPYFHFNPRSFIYFARSSAFLDLLPAS
jgi:hypothetical protein